MSDRRILIFDKTDPIERQIRGGNGMAQSRLLVTADNKEPGAPFISAGVNTLPPGTTIGTHRHAGNAEAYVVISGSGLYINKDGEKIRVKQGDLTLCYDGEIHGMENDTDQPMVVAGLVAE